MICECHGNNMDIIQYWLENPKSKLPNPKQFKMSKSKIQNRENNYG